MNEPAQSKRPGKNAQGALLSANPQRTGHRRTLAGPVLYCVPESLRKALIAAESVGSNQRIDEQKSGGLENKFQVAIGGRCKSHLRPRLMRRDPLACDRILKPSRRESACEG